MSDNTTRMFDKIKALFNKAENTTNEAEAEAFWDKASSLMAKHAIDERDLNLWGDKGPAPIEHRKIKGEDLWGKSPYSNARSTMFWRIAKILGCTAYVSRTYSGRATAYVGIIGTDAAIERTIQVFKIANLQADRAVLKARPDDYYTSVSVYRRSMFDGFTTAFVQKLKDSIATASSETGDTPGFGLVLLDDGQRSKQWQQENIQLGRIGRSSQQTSGAGRRAGTSAGENATIGGQGSFSGRRAIGS